MDDSGPRRVTRREERRGLRDALLIAVGLVAVLAVVPFGAVHPGARLALAAATGIVGVAAVLARSRAAPLTGRALSVGFLSAGVLSWSALAFIPVGPAARERLQPAVAGPVNDALALVGAAHHPLALDPWRGLVEWAVFAGAVALMLGTAELVRHRLRARLLGTILVIGAVGFAVLGLAQIVSGAERIFWISDLPVWHPMHSDAQRRFFGTMVSPNHAGALLAGTLPIAVALLRGRRTTERVAGWLGVVLLGLAIVATSSRGAVLEVGLAMVAFAALASGRAGRTALGVAGALGVLLVVWRGPQTVALDVTAAIDPITARGVEHGWTDVVTGRTDLYADTWRLVADGPLVGVGPAGFDDAYCIVKSTPGFAVSTHAHQEALQLAAEGGLPALLMWLALLGVLAAGLPAALAEEHPPERRWLACGFAGSLVALLVAASFDFPYRSGALSTLSAVSAGGLLGLSAGRKPRRTGATSGAWRVHAWRASVAVAGGGAVLAVLCALVLRGGTSVFADAGELVERGDAAQQQGDLDSAVDAWRAAIAAQPVRRDALQKLAAGVEQQGDVATAARALEVATEVYPTLPWPWRDLARVQLRRGEYDAAMVAWREMLALDLPGDEGLPRHYVAEALEAAADAGLPDPLSQALAVLPPRGDRWRDAAVLADRVGARSDAEALFQEAIALDPSVRVAWASFLLRWGRVSEGLTELDAARADGFDGCRSRLLTAEALWSRDGCDGLPARVEAASGLCAAGDVDLRLAQARARVCTNDPRAVEILQRLVADEPALDRARRLLVAVLIERGRTDDAQVHLEALEARQRITQQEAEQLQRMRAGKPLLPQP